CEIMEFEVGIPRPDFLDGADYLGTKVVDGFLCNVWEKVEFIWYYEDVLTQRPVGWDFYDEQYLLQGNAYANFAISLFCSLYALYAFVAKKFAFYPRISTHVITFEVGAVLQDSVTQAPAYCFSQGNSMKL
ncbi:hypothetical protein RJ639_030853, partial [Escallonia herrerae]